MSGVNRRRDGLELAGRGLIDGGLVGACFGDDALKYILYPHPEDAQRLGIEGGEAAVPTSSAIMANRYRIATVTPCSRLAVCLAGKPGIKNPYAGTTYHLSAIPVDP